MQEQQVSNVPEVGSDVAEKPAGTAEMPGRKSKAGQRWSRAGLAVLPVILLILVWHVAATVWIDRPRIFPPPSMVAAELLRIASGESAVGSSYGHAFATLRRLVAAFVLSFVVGGSLGVLAGRQRFAFNMLSSLVWTCMAVPAVAWAFIFVIAIGINDLVPILAVSAILGSIVLINIAEGAKAVPEDLVEMADSYKVHGIQRVRDLFVPHLAPYLASSARISFAVGIKVVVVAEVIGLPSGIGFELNYWYSNQFIAPIVAWGVVLIGVGLTADYGVFAPIERHAGAWRGVDSGRSIAQRAG